MEADADEDDVLEPWKKTAVLRLVLRSCHNKLVESFHVDDLRHIMDFQYTKGFLEQSHLERIMHEVTTHEKIGKFLAILKKKGYRAYRLFVESLHAHEIFQNLSRELQGCESQAIKVIADVQAWWVSQTCYVDGQKLPIDNLLRTLKQTLDNPLKDLINREMMGLILTGINKNWSIWNITTQELQTCQEGRNGSFDEEENHAPFFLSEPFVSVETKQQTLALSECATPSNSSQATANPSSHSTGKSSVPSQPTEWQVNDVLLWLEKIGINEKSIGKFRHHCVDGLTLLSITEDELKSEVGVEAFGERKKIMRHLRSLNSHGENMTPNETENLQSAALQGIDKASVASFGHGLADTNSQGMGTQLRKFLTFSPACIYPYDLGATLNMQDPPASLLDPVRYCFPLNLADKNQKGIFSTDLMKFVCACLNDRRNGTMYLGLDCTGQVIGTQLAESKEKYNNNVKKLICQSFPSDLSDIVLGCVRPIVFVPVKSDNPNPIYVLEIDVYSSYDLCQSEAFFISLSSENALPKSKSFDLFRWGDDIKEIVECGKIELRAYMQIKERLSECRKNEEQAARGTPVLPLLKPNLRDELVRLLCMGEDTFSGECYNVLVLGKPDGTLGDNFIKENLSFISNIPCKAILDLDSNAQLFDYFETKEEKVYRSLPDLSIFKQHGGLENTSNESLHEKIESWDFLPWIFLNNYRKPPLKLEEWRQNLNIDFKALLVFLQKQFPVERTNIIVLLFGEERDILLSVCEDLFVYFRAHWLVLSDKDDLISKPFRNELRGFGHQATDRFIIMPWNHVRETVAQINGPQKTDKCKLISSNGVMVTLPNKLRNEWTNLDIVSCTACSDAPITADPVALRKFEKEEEERFYKGAEASWWNFFFQSHVFRRKQLQKLREEAIVALNRPKEHRDDRYIGKVVLDHQPGAGGTTVAKQLLWDLRTQYRCVIVKNIADDTADHLVKLRSYKDDNPNPMLVLIDNIEDDRVAMLWATLEDRAKVICRRKNDEGQTDSFVFCVFLLCLRKSKIKPLPVHKECYVHLNHKLEPQETNWFEKKFECMESDYRNKKRFLNPKDLISFNIMKENFDQKFIQSMTRRLLEDIDSEKERKFVTYLAILNSFDDRMYPVPPSVFDVLMTNADKQLFWGSGRSAAMLAGHKRWENCMSETVKLLVVFCKSPDFIHGLRLVNSVLAKEILDIMKETTCNGDLSQIVLNFLNDDLVFVEGSRQHSIDILVKTLKYIVIHRKKQTDGKPETLFAPLIQELISYDIDAASEVLKRVFQLSRDAFVAQQLARLFISAQNWEKASQYAKEATDVKADNSYLWDTRGRICLKQIAHAEQDLMVLTVDERVLSLSKSMDIIKLHVEGSKHFRRSQEVSQVEKTLYSNDAGFLGEVSMAKMILGCLRFSELFESIDEFRRVLIDRDYWPEKLEEMIKSNEFKSLLYLKDMQSNCMETIRRLEDEWLQLHQDTLGDTKTNYHNTGELDGLKTSLDYFFGEESDYPPESCKEESDLCKFRSRRIIQLGGTSLRRMLDMNEGEKLWKVLKFAQANIESGLASADDYECLISVALSLVTKNDEALRLSVTYADLIPYSQALYRLRGRAKPIHLEVYMFYIMFNWPRNVFTKPPPSTLKLALPLQLNEALREWKDAYYKKYPRQKEHAGSYLKRKVSTLFFFSNGSELNSITSHRNLQLKQRIAEQDFWESPHVLRTLKRFSGILSDGGLSVDVEITTLTGNRGTINIATSMYVNRQALWNKKVYFVIGFTPSGPLAFDVSESDPTVSLDMSEDPQVLRPDATRSYKVTEQWMLYIDKRIEIIEKDLMRIENIKTRKREKKRLCKEDKQLLDKESKLLKERDKALEDRRRHVDLEDF